MVSMNNSAGKFPRAGFATAAFLSLAAISSVSASAQNRFGGNLVTGIEIVKNVGYFEGTTPLWSNKHFLSGSNLCATMANYFKSPFTGVGYRVPRNFQKYVGKTFPEIISEELRSRANSTSLRGTGFSIRSDARTKMSPKCQARAEVRDASGRGNINVVIRLFRNASIFYLTTPNFIPGGADPKLSVDFDLEFRFRIMIPETTRQRVRFSAVAVHISNIREPDSQNVTGDAVIGIARLLKSTVMPGLFRSMTKDRVLYLGNLKPNLARFDSIISRLPFNLRLKRSWNGRVVIHIPGKTRTNPDTSKRVPRQMPRLPETRPDMTKKPRWRSYQHRQRTTPGDLHMPKYQRHKRWPRGKNSAHPWCRSKNPTVSRRPAYQGSLLRKKNCEVIKNRARKRQPTYQRRYRNYYKWSHKKTYRQRYNYPSSILR